MAESKATSAHTEQPGGHTGVFPPFDKTTYASQLFWLVICFVALYLLIARTAVPRISGILEQRTKRIENDFAEAQRDKEQSEAALVAYEKALADARTRAQAIGTEIREKVHAQAEENRKALESKLNTQLADAEKLIASTKTAAMTNVRGIAVDAASAIVERLTGAAPAAPVVAAAVDAALKR